MIRIRLSFVAFFLSLSYFISFPGNATAQQHEATLHDLNKLLVNTVMDDQSSLLVASRIYTYPNIAFYECIIHYDTSFKSLSGKLTGLRPIPSPSIKANIDYFISACYSFSFVAQALVGTEEKFFNWRQDFGSTIRNSASQDVLRNSINYGKLMADSILAWAKRDNYNASMGTKLKPHPDNEDTLRSAPSDNTTALEANWNKLRLMVLKSCSQFTPVKKLVYSTAKESEFYKNVQEVYNMSKNPDSLKKAKALYWDDSPNVSVQEANTSNSIHKISPGGHWMMIAGQACKQNKVSIIKSSLAYTLTSISIFDAFIACWDEKYRTNLIRPVTVINQTIDEKWVPLIQSPPVPEFPSAHAMISNSAATVLTSLLGEKISFIDSTEVPFGISPRSFKSFYEASEEASWSRVYGGVNYPETARISIQMGKQIGNYISVTCYKPPVVKSKKPATKTARPPVKK